MNAEQKKRFMAKLVGDTGEQVLRKTAREVGTVEVEAKRDGYTVWLRNTEFRGEGKSLRAAIMQALKLWHAD
jgi:hypothetical protein